MNNTILGKFAKAFELWEQGFRTDPTKFLTYEEAAKMGVSELSAERAAYFYQLLEEVISNERT